MMQRVARVCQQQLSYLLPARRYASEVLVVIVCPSVGRSVRLSVTRRCCTETAKRRITQTTPYDSPTVKAGE